MSVRSGCEVVVAAATLMGIRACASCVGGLIARLSLCSPVSTLGANIAGSTHPLSMAGLFVIRESRAHRLGRARTCRIPRWLESKAGSTNRTHRTMSRPHRTARSGRSAPAVPSFTGATNRVLFFPFGRQAVDPGCVLEHHRAKRVWVLNAGCRASW